MLRFTSVLKQEFQPELERLIYFNPGQKHIYAAIEHAVEKYGSPVISVKNGKLKVATDKLSDSQALFTLTDKKLIAVMIYCRLSHESMTVIHTAIDEDYTSSGQFANKMVMLRQLNVLRESARRIRGVRSIHLMIDGKHSAQFGLSGRQSCR